MRGIRGLAWAALLAVGLSATAAADDMVLEDFGDGASKRWQYAADTVMGGVSDGGAVVAMIDGQPGIRLTGTVSTVFNGGFIQVRRLLRDGLPAATTGIEMDVRGNDQRYYLFIRTSEMSRPWYYYGESFEACTSWQKVQLSLDSFERSHAHLSESIDPEEIISIAIVAFGRDHEADISVRRIALF
ncbi:CIA30 family protein [Roseobacter denitrificans]|nr:CIA30 family protein [Roseobacter denitrificans]SFG23081.1 Complex I intermediate-associated protein 30 (CIA30) [Roseobacter denitrificans OCh 114]